MAEQERERDSLHGETAARRQAITELLFFASVGDLYRCKKITYAWGLQLKDPNCCDYDKRTPLHLAAAEGAYSVVRWILDQGANPNPVDRFSRTPLEDAVRGDLGEVVNLLIQRGGKVADKNGDLIDLAESGLAGNVRIFDGFDPEWEIDPAAIFLKEKIGEGEFGVVHKAIWNGTLVAVKVLKETGAVALGDFRTELNILQKVHHPHTVQFLGAVTKATPFMIVTEYMGGGSLADMYKVNKSPTLWRAVQLALDCARGLAYLHDRTPQAVIHRDLKPANLMIGGPKIYNPYHRKLAVEEVGFLKIADFGLSKSLKLQKPRHKYHRGSEQSGRTDNSASSHQPTSPTGLKTSYKLTGETGSYRYMAPEVYRHEQYNYKVDVYSFAMICYQLFEGVPPFWTMDPLEAARGAALEKKRPQWGENRKGTQTLPALRQLVEECWHPDYEMRPDFEDVVVRLEAIAAGILGPPTHEPARSCTCSVM